MADKPLIPGARQSTPEIMPEEAKAVRPDSIIATGRSDYSNQVTTCCASRSFSVVRLDVGATAHHRRDEARVREGHRRLAQAEQ